MKNLHLILTAVVLTMLIVLFMNGISTNAAEEVEIMVLIESAETPEDHIKIAEYYEVQAANMEKMASQHESMGKAYKNRSKPMSGMAIHCSKLSKESRESAEQYNAMAKEHEKMAHEMMNHDSDSQ